MRKVVVLFLLLCPAAHAAATATQQVRVGTHGSDLAFEPARITVSPGAAVELVFTNNASKDSNMRHTWVLVRPGSEFKVTRDGSAAGASKGYVPDSPDVLAHTQVVAPGASETIRFTAPAQPGEYSYLCVVPGHYPSMHGVLEVRK